MSEDPQVQKDKMRLCPICRMPISVWAIRCRFCGETVGRPKKEVETFTIEDLGGETPTARTLVSNEVLEAIEEFRKGIIETPPKEEKKSIWNLWGKQGKPSGTQGKKNSRTSYINPIHWIVTVGIIILLSILTYFFGPTVWSQAKHLLQGKENNLIEYENQALAMLERGEPIEKVVKEALTAYEMVPTEENKKILDHVRTKLIEMVNTLLTKEPYNPTDAAEASRICSEVIKIDYDSKIQDLYRKTMVEISAYKMTITQIDMANKKAHFQLNNPSYPLKEQIVTEGELIQDRFLVKQILPSRVRLEDTKIINDGKPRRLSLSLLGNIVADV